MNELVAWLRRHVTLVAALLALAWILIVVVWITVSPIAGTGNPMD